MKYNAYLDYLQKTIKVSILIKIRPRISMKGSVRPSVRGPSVVRFLTAEFKPKSDLTSINAPAHRA